MKSLLVGHDGSEQARQAVSLAGRVAARLGARPIVVTTGYMVTAVGTAVIPTLDESAFEPIAAEGATIARALGAETDTHVAFGAPERVLVDLATHEARELIVIGHHGRGGMAGVLLGSTAKKVATAAPCPVLVVAGAAPTTIKQVLVTLSPSEHARRAAGAGLVLARAFGAQVSLLGVLDPVVVSGAHHATTAIRLQGSLVEQHRRLLLEVGETCRADGLACDIIEAEGRPADVISRLVQDRGYDLITIGRRDRGSLSRMVLGSTSDSVLAGAACPVLVAGAWTGQSANETDASTSID